MRGASNQITNTSTALQPAGSAASCCGQPEPGGLEHRRARSSRHYYKLASPTCPFLSRAKPGGSAGAGLSVREKRDRINSQVSESGPPKRRSCSFVRMPADLRQEFPARLDLIRRPSRLRSVARVHGSNQ